MKSHYEMFAAYNRWANERLYEATEKVSDADYRRPLGAFFGSLNGTLNHLIVSDRIWMHRFTGEGPTYTRLNEIAYDDFAELANARRDEDERIIAYVESLNDADLGERFSYRMVSRPDEVTQVRSSALAHLFNHQTHHRGQAHTLLTIVGGRDAAPSMDLLYFQRETGIGL
jgi:uncharacterized damage-inducible protein DinB